MIATSEKGPNLTLYGIEMQLIQLLNFRDEVSTDPDMTPAEQKESLEAIDRQIQEYVTAEVKKVDGVAHYLREFEARAEVLKQEAARCNALAKAWEKRHENLEQMIISIMQQTGATRLDGRTSVLSLRKNPPACEVQSPDLVPAELQRVKFTLSRQCAEDIEECLQDLVLLCNERGGNADPYREVLNALRGQLADAEPEPMKDEIKKRLRQPCERCNGRGVFHDTTAAMGTGEYPCADCGGTGKEAVPGCRLTQGVRLEVR